MFTKLGKVNSLTGPNIGDLSLKIISEYFVVYLDVRTQNFFEGRSINLSLSTRGLEALEVAGVSGPVRFDENSAGLWYIDNR